MEFFAELTNQTIDAEQLFELITIPRLPELCASIDSVTSLQSPDHGEIYCLWGQFQVSREKIRNGVRFGLLNCPHALTWTVTTHLVENRVVVHSTIDKRDEEKEFVESIELFVKDWALGLDEKLRS